MTAFQSWQPPYHAMCPQPGRDDLFLVILVNGFRMDIRGIDEWRYWWEHAGTLAQEHKVNIKVLPMTGSELMNFCGFKPEPGPLRPMSAILSFTRVPYAIAETWCSATVRLPTSDGKQWTFSCRWERRCNEVWPART